jgi:hypothetical protein
MEKKKLKGPSFVLPQIFVNEKFMGFAWCQMKTSNSEYFRLTEKLDQKALKVQGWCHNGSYWSYDIVGSRHDLRYHYQIQLFYLPAKVKFSKWNFEFFKLFSNLPGHNEIWLNEGKVAFAAGLIPYSIVDGKIKILCANTQEGYCFFGGNVEVGRDQSPLDVAMREFNEETYGTFSSDELDSIRASIEHSDPAKILRCIRRMKDSPLVVLAWLTFVPYITCEMLNNKKEEVGRKEDMLIHSLSSDKEYFFAENESFHYFEPKEIELLIDENFGNYKHIWNQNKIDISKFLSSLGILYFIFY